MLVPRGQGGTCLLSLSYVLVDCLQGWLPDVFSESRPCLSTVFEGQLWSQVIKVRSNLLVDWLGCTGTYHWSRMFLSIGHSIVVKWSTSPVFGLFSGVWKDPLVADDLAMLFDAFSSDLEQELMTLDCLQIQLICWYMFQLQAVFWCM